MLKVNKSTTISATSSVDGKVVVTMNASIPDAGNISASTYINDKTLYDANKVEVQADMNAFNDLVYGLEDNGNENEKQ